MTIQWKLGWVEKVGQGKGWLCLWSQNQQIKCPGPRSRPSCSVAGQQLHLLHQIEPDCSYVSSLVPLSSHGSYFAFNWCLYAMQWVMQHHKREAFVMHGTLPLTLSPPALPLSTHISNPVLLPNWLFWLLAAHHATIAAVGQPKYHFFPRHSFCTLHQCKVLLATQVV